MINIGFGRDITIRELAQIVKDIVGFEGELAFDLSRPDGTLRKLLDVSNLDNLGWRPGISLKDGIRDIYDWYAKNAEL